MKSLFTVILLGWAVSVAAGPAYLKTAKGVVVSGLVQREEFLFQPGELGSCEKRPHTDFTVYECPLKNTQAVITSEKGTQWMDFHKVFIFYQGFNRAREYTFHGTWNEETKGMKISSPVYMTLWYFESSPSQIKGVLNLAQYGISAGIEAVQQ